MEVKIGIADTGRELTVNVTASPEEIEEQVAESLRTPDGTLRLTDDKGRRVIVPSNKVAYVEVAPADSRRVGFALSG
ncbi:MAG TPA: DUF3107 domain-containing protein [Nakamurella sp.]|nr:DUF3107 domain-containing protein [Nakamurella sp.]